MNILADLLSGFRFLYARRVLFYLMFYAAVLNFLLTGPMNLATPYLLALTGSREMLGILLGVFNIGYVTGGIAMVIWGGTRPRIHGIMLGLLFRGAWIVVYGFVRTPVWLGIALFCSFVTSALIDGSLFSLLQAKVPAHMQGRVFAAMMQMMNIASPLSLLVTAFLVDGVLEPMVGQPGWAVVAPLVGSHSGSGMGLLLSLSGVLALLLTAVVYALPAVRRVEQTLPDYTAQPVPVPVRS